MPIESKFRLEHRATSCILKLQNINPYVILQGQGTSRKVPARDVQVAQPMLPLSAVEHGQAVTYGFRNMTCIGIVALETMEGILLKAPGEGIFKQEVIRSS